MEILDAAKGVARLLVLLLELGLVAAGNEPARGELDPVIVGIGAALEHLLRGQGGGQRCSRFAAAGRWSPLPHDWRRQRTRRSRVPSTTRAGYFAMNLLAFIGFELVG